MYLQIHHIYASYLFYRLIYNKIIQPDTKISLLEMLNENMWEICVRRINFPNKNRAE